jgi:hypothetical protein
VLDFYRRLAQRDKVLLWVAVIAGGVWILGSGGNSAGIVAGAQVAAALGTFVLAGLAYAQVREMRQARREASRPHVLVEADQTNPPHVYVVVRNIGQGPAKNITFEFSDVMRDLDAVSGYAVGIGPYKQDVDAALVEAAHEHCLAVHPYTVNTVEEMEALIALGVDGMFTNNPDLLDGVLGDDALSGEAAAQQAAEAYRECSAGL